MAKEEKVKMDGTVTEALPNAMFKVDVDGHVVLGQLAGILRRRRVRVAPGDEVSIEISPYDLTRGRIVQRYR